MRRWRDITVDVHPQFPEGGSDSGFKPHGVLQFVNIGRDI